MVAYTHPHIKRKVKKLDKELEVNTLAKMLQHQFDEGENNISFSCKDIIDLLLENPEWHDINKEVIRKGFE